MYYSISGIFGQPKDTTTKVLLFVTLKSSTFCYFGSGARLLLSTHMTVDLYHDIYTSEVFQKTQCIWHENIMMDFFRSQLISLGYTPANDSRKVWRRGDQTVVVCLADDFATCGPMDQILPMAQMFDSKTVVITDNQVNSPTQYQVAQLPHSYFGIYNYVPHITEWTPERRFSFAVNRLDSKRLRLFLELVTRTLYPNSRVFDLDRDYVNFNCWHWQSSNDSAEVYQQNFLNEFEFVPNELKDLYSPALKHMTTLMPYRNYTKTLDELHSHVWMNMIVETYSGDTVIALSEKLFRALVTPVPWIVYGGRYTVAYLRQMGFDVMDDLVAHNYDYELERDTGEFGDKMVDFVREGHDAVEKFKAMPWDELSQRCQQGATHNQKLLAQMQVNWPVDFAKWLPGVIEKIK